MERKGAASRSLMLERVARGAGMNGVRRRCRSQETFHEYHHASRHRSYRYIAWRRRFLRPRTLVLIRGSRIGRVVTFNSGSGNVG